MPRSSPSTRLARGPFAPDFWRSPLRGPWFTSVLGVVLLAGVTILFVTGLLSYAAYNPDLAPVNDKTPGKGILGFYLFSWPTDPPWLYRLTQGVHVTLGLVLVPVLLAKLWSVVPRLFTLPPARSLTHALERISLLLLVGGALFEFTTGILNVQLDYVFPGSFYPLHFYGAWVFFGAFAAHVALKAPVAFRNLRRMREGGGEDADGLVAPRPDPPTVSRRGALGLVGGGSLLLFVTSAGRSFDGPLRETAVLTPHGGPEPGGGPAGFQINKTAAYAGIRPAETTEEAWRLVVTGRSGTVRLDRAELLGMPLHSASLPIACVEGWSTSDQWWRGVRLRDLAALVGHEEPVDVFVESLQRRGAFRRGALRANQVADPRSLLALFVNGEELTADHGYPARIIVPAAPGVLATKWVARLTFGEL
ncbi:molybdopterin-dependent oxidoreductase [Streptomyces sp. NPDC051740]|uniref:molybdopterin-dependent oxidoreductase n=1 Tax=Streptomyces sp. NPDC051740 TaxID=3365673 RepID=UPI003792A7F6